MNTKLKQVGTEIAALVLCTVFFFWYLSNSFGALFVDEVVYTVSGYNLITGRNIFMYLEHPPLVKYLIGLFLVLFGISSSVARLSSIVLGVATVYLTFMIAKEIKKESIGLLSVIMLGSTPLFASHSTMAMLDIPLTFFVALLALLTLKYVHARPKKRKIIAMSLGVVSGFVATSKFYGIYFIVPAMIFGGYYAFNELRTKGTTTPGTHSLAPMIQKLAQECALCIFGFGVTFLLVYIPYLPDLAGVFSYAYEYNLVHMKGGHRVIVAGQVYTYPPLWTYFYWLTVDASPLYLIGLTLSIFVIWKLKDESKLFALMTGIPFVIFSLMPVKFPRYLIPILPFCSILTAISITYLVTVLLHFVFRASFSPLRWTRKTDMRTVSYVTFLFLLLLPSSPLYCALTDPHIGIDSEYDLAARIVIEIAVDCPNMVVLSWYAPCLEFYIPPENREKNNITVLNIAPSTPRDNKTHQMLLEGKVDLSVMYEEYPRFPDSPTINYILSHAFRKEHVGKGRLYIFYMKNCTQQDSLLDRNKTLHHLVKGSSRIDGT